MNGLVGTLWDLVVDADPWDGVTAATVAILKVKRSDVRGLEDFLPTITGAREGEWADLTLLPVPTVERAWRTAQGREQTRRHLPLRSAFAITIQKSQGMTIQRVILDPGETETHSGILFTGLSRVPALARLALSSSIDFARLQVVYKSDAIRKRKAWEHSWSAAAGRFCEFLVASARAAGSPDGLNESTAAQWLADLHGFGVHF